MPLSRVPFDAAPWRFSGNVYGTLLNRRGALAALGAAVHAAPYKAPPKAVVMYIKPRNTLVGAGDDLSVPDDVPELEVGASLGLVIGRVACRVREADALGHLAGYTIVVDAGVPHASFFRPQIRSKARDRSCAIGPQVVARRDIADPDALAIRVFVDGTLVDESSTSGSVRSVARLVADVSDFITLWPGDVLMTGVAHGAPRVRAGQRAAVEIDGLGRLDSRFVAAGRGGS